MPSTDLIVLYDELAFPLGTIRDCASADRRTGITE